MICYKCGTENKGGDKFCSGCGEILNMDKIDAKKINTDGLELVKEEVNDVVVKKSSNKIIIIVALVIIAVVAIIGVPRYYTKLKAEKIIEVTTLARTKISDYARKHKQWPQSAREIEFNAAQYTNGMFELSINKGVIELTLPEEPGKTARIMPAMNKNGHIVWECENGGIGRDYLPLGCFRNE